jgi:phage gp37-like protein
MADLNWTALEDAVLAALESQLGQAVPTLATYQGDWQEDLRRQAWRLPAVLVMLAQSRAAQVGHRSYELTLDFTFLVVCRALRGEAEGRRQEGGAYQILAGIRQALWHQDLGLGLLPFSLVREEPWLNAPEFTVYAAHYRTGALQDF